MLLIHPASRPSCSHSRPLLGLNWLTSGRQTQLFFGYILEGDYFLAKATDRLHRRKNARQGAYVGPVPDGNELIPGQLVGGYDGRSGLPGDAGPIGIDAAVDSHARFGRHQVHLAHEAIGLLLVG